MNAEKLRWTEPTCYIVAYPEAAAPPRNLSLEKESGGLMTLEKQRLFVVFSMTGTVVSSHCCSDMHAISFCSDADDCLS